MDFFDLSIYGQAATWVSLLTLTAMEIVLGIDNVIFISILVAKLPEKDQKKARQLGLSLALVLRLALLFTLSWLMKLTEPLFTLPIVDEAISGRDLILLLGGLFLIGKSAHEIHDKLEVQHDVDGDGVPDGKRSAFAIILVQILLLDVVFSFDSVITAVGMARHISIMVIAMVVAVGVMLVFAGRIGDFVNRHPSVKILALSFLLLIGVMLVAEGMGQHISKGYVYFAMAFALLVEVMNMRLRKKSAAPVHLHGRFENTTPSPS
jgi:predicted tellurium resistance membrane protein TerC